jgi:mRNA interferase YafQ
MMTKREIHRTTQFRRDLRKAYKQGKNIDILDKIITMLANDEPLPEKFRDHALSGNWKGYRECHITLTGYWSTEKRRKRNCF